MKVLSVRQPWAGLIFAGKDVENRPRPTSHRGPLLIHASLTAQPWPHLLPELLTRPIAEVVALCQRKGQILGIVNVVDCVRDHSSWWADEGQWHWMLSDAVTFADPIPATGHLGLWKYDLKSKMTVQPPKGKR